MLNGVPEHHRVPVVPSTEADRDLVGVPVVLNVGQWHPLGLELIAQVGVEQLDGDLVSRSYGRELIKELVPRFPGTFMDNVRATTSHHRRIIAPRRPEH